MHVIPLETSLAEITCCGILIEEVTHELPIKVGRVHRAFLVTDHRHVEIGVIRWRTQWNRYIFEPRESILLTSKFLVWVASVVDRISAYDTLGSTNNAANRRPIDACLPAINLCKLSKAERAALIQTRPGK